MADVGTRQKEPPTVDTAMERREVVTGYGPVFELLDHLRITPDRFRDRIPGVQLVAIYELIDGTAVEINYTGRISHEQAVQVLSKHAAREHHQPDLFREIAGYTDREGLPFSRMCAFTPRPAGQELPEIEN